MSDQLKLQFARERLAAEIDRQVATFQDALARVWRQLDRQLVKLVDEAAAGSTSAIVRAARAGRLKQQIEVALDKAGFADLIDRSTGTNLEAVVTDVTSLRLAAQVASFSGADSNVIEALKIRAASRFVPFTESVSDALSQATIQGVFGSRPASLIVDDLSAVLDVSAANARTLFDTSISAFARQVETLSVPQDPDRPFVYTGPNDEKVRPFCRAHLGKVYTKDAIDKMSNGQTGVSDVWTYCGGWNCRHGWTAVSKFSTLRDMANTGERVPEFSRGIEDGGSKAA